MLTYLTVTAVMYFVPSIIALSRRPANMASIIVMSLILGWFPLISLVCVIWAATAKKLPPKKFQLVFK
jgi:hypothetical protein